MRIRRTIAAGVAVLGVVWSAASAASAAQLESRGDVSIRGGVQALNGNDTAFPDHFINIPGVVSAAYHLTPVVAVEGEFTWIVPLKQNIDAGTSGQQDRKSPDILAYQAGVRADLPGAAWRPYLAAGAGAMTFLSSTDVDRMPQLAESQTVFAVSFGTGVTYRLTDRWALRGDFREFVGFPSDTAVGLSDGTGADPIWMERGTVGLAAQF